MTGSIRIGVVMAVACCLLLHASYGFSESIEDGYITRSDASVCLKNGNVVQCGNILWLTQAADYLQCDQGGTCREIKIDDVDVEKTFGSKIAREYEASKAQLENAVAREKEKMRENVVSYENNPSGSAGEDGPSDASDETTGTEGAARDSSQASGAYAEEAGTVQGQAHTGEGEGASRPAQEVPGGAEKGQGHGPRQNSLPGSDPSGEERHCGYAAGGVLEKKDSRCRSKVPSNREEAGRLYRVGTPGASRFTEGCQGHGLEKYFRGNSSLPSG